MVIDGVQLLLSSSLANIRIGWFGFVKTEWQSVKIWVGVNPWSFGIPCGVEIVVAAFTMKASTRVAYVDTFRRCFVKNLESLEQCNVLDEIVGSKHVLMFLTKLGRKVWVETKFRHL